MDATARHASANSRPPAAGTERPPIAAARRLSSSSSSSTTLITSGQTAVRDGELVAHGVVGDDDLEMARECAWQCARNVAAAALGELGSLDDIRQVTRITVYVASAPGFERQHLVADAATEYFLQIFGPEIGRHARAAIGVAALPTGSPVEVDAIFELAG